MFQSLVSQINTLLNQQISKDSPKRDFWVVFNNEQTPYLAEIGRMHPAFITEHKNATAAQQSLQDFCILVYNLNNKNKPLDLANEPDATCMFHTFQDQTTQKTICYLDLIAIKDKQFSNKKLGKELIDMLHYITTTKTPATQVQGNINYHSYLKKETLKTIYKKMGFKVKSTQAFQYEISKNFESRNNKKHLQSIKNRIVSVPNQNYSLNILLTPQLASTLQNEPTPTLNKQ